MICQQNKLPHFLFLNQLSTLPVKIPPHSYQNKHQRKPLKLSPKTRVLVFTITITSISYFFSLCCPQFHSKFWFPKFTPLSWSICTTQPSTFRMLSLTTLYYIHIIYPLQLIINVAFKRTTLIHKFWHLLTPYIESILKYNYIFQNPSAYSSKATFYTTAKFTSLLLYPTSPYLIKYHLQLYPTSHIIGITHISYNFLFRCHTNKNSLLTSCSIPNTDSNQNSHRWPNYRTTYNIINFSIFSPL